MRDLTHRSAWIFDVDYTLYGPDSALFEQVVPRITQFVAGHLNLSIEKAREVQRHYYLTYGSTMAGMARHHDVDPHDYSAFVHNIDYSVLRADPALKAKIQALPGQAFIFTNATMTHARDVLAGLGLSLDDFDGAFDVEMAEWTPKPDPRPYHQVMETFAIDPAQAVFFEDTAKNLKTAEDLGWSTVWIRAENDARQAGQSYQAALTAPCVNTALDQILAVV